MRLVRLASRSSDGAAASGVSVRRADSSASCVSVAGTSPDPSVISADSRFAESICARRRSASMSGGAASGSAPGSGAPPGLVVSTPVVMLGSAAGSGGSGLSTSVVPAVGVPEGGAVSGGSGVMADAGSGIAGDVAAGVRAEAGTGAGSARLAVDSISMMVSPPRGGSSVSAVSSPTGVASSSSWSISMMVSRPRDGSIAAAAAGSAVSPGSASGRGTAASGLDAVSGAAETSTVMRDSPSAEWRTASRSAVSWPSPAAAPAGVVCGSALSDSFCMVDSSRLYRDLPGPGFLSGSDQCSVGCVKVPRTRSTATTSSLIAGRRRRRQPWR